jgi:hypothetical protein
MPDFLQMVAYVPNSFASADTIAFGCRGVSPDP